MSTKELTVLKQEILEQVTPSVTKLRLDMAQFNEMCTASGNTALIRVAYGLDNFVRATTELVLKKFSDIPETEVDAAANFAMQVNVAIRHHIDDFEREAEADATLLQHWDTIDNLFEKVEQLLELSDKACSPGVLRRLIRKFIRSLI